MSQRLYRIGEVAQATGLPVKTIRYYAEIGLLAPAATAPSGYRLYGESEIWHLGLVRTLRRLGFGLNEIRRLLIGETDVASVVVLQLDAVELEIRQLERVRAALRRARPAVGNDAASLERLRDVGSALAMSEAERSRFLADRLLDLASGRDSNDEWRARLLDSMAKPLPAEFTPEQVDAWGELVGLLGDPSSREDARARAEPFRAMTNAPGLDPAAWHDRMEHISHGGREALRAGEGPDSTRVQAIVADWIALFAQAMGRPPDAEFERTFAAMAPTWIDPRGRRIRDLLAVLDWGGEGDEPWRAEQLLLDGLAWRTARPDHRPGDAPPGGYPASTSTVSPS